VTKTMTNKFQLNLKVVSTTEWFSSIGRQLARATKLRTVVPNTWGSIVSFSCVRYFEEAPR